MIIQVFMDNGHQWLFSVHYYSSFQQCPAFSFGLLSFLPLHTTLMGLFFQVSTHPCQDWHKFQAQQLDAFIKELKVKKMSQRQNIVGADTCYLQCFKEPISLVIPMYEQVLLF